MIRCLLKNWCESCRRLLTRQSEEDRRIKEELQLLVVRIIEPDGDEGVMSAAIAALKVAPKSPLVDPSERNPHVHWQHDIGPQAAQVP